MWAWQLWPPVLALPVSFNWNTGGLVVGKQDRHLALCLLFWRGGRGQLMSQEWKSIPMKDLKYKTFPAWLFLAKLSLASKFSWGRNECFIRQRLSMEVHYVPKSFQTAPVRVHTGCLPCMYIHGLTLLNHLAPRTPSAPPSSFGRNSFVTQRQPPPPLPPFARFTRGIFASSQCTAARSSSPRAWGIKLTH